MGMKRTILVGLLGAALVQLAACDLPDKSIGDDGASVTSEGKGTDDGGSDDGSEGSHGGDGDGSDTAGDGGHGCYSHADCPDGLVCNAEDVCLPSPGCDNPELDCPAVCYGECVEPDDGEATCEALQDAYTAEIVAAAACTSVDECGQTVGFGNCGCTNATVVRIDYDIEHLESLWTEAWEMACDFTQVDGTCDCPEADGFACIAGRCTWNYL